MVVLVVPPTSDFGGRAVVSCFRGFDGESTGCAEGRAGEHSSSFWANFDSDEASRRHQSELSILLTDPVTDSAERRRPLLCSCGEAQRRGAPLPAHSPAASPNCDSDVKEHSGDKFS